MLTWILSLLVGVLAGFAVASALDEDIDQPLEQRALVASVVDGDTVILENGDAVRYLGIDTPEVASQDCYAAEATERNRALVEDEVVILIADEEDKDQYGRLLRWVFLDDGTFVNAELIWEGYATTLFFNETRYRQVFTQLQLAASRNQAGGWSDCGWL